MIFSKMVVQLTVAGVVLLTPPLTARAQDTTAVRPAVSVDTLRSPITPKRAFLTSLLFPGAAQTRLGRHRVGVGIIAVEVMSIAMIREAGAGVREARRQSGDSIVLSYVDDNGVKLSVPQLERRRFAADEVRSRRSHVEDWVALLVANHLFAAADGFVSASLWDVNARVTVGGTRNNFLLGARVEW